MIIDSLIFLVVIGLIVTVIVYAVKLEGARDALEEAYEQIDEDEEYIAELREDLTAARAEFVTRRVPGRKSGIIARAQRT